MMVDQKKKKRSVSELNLRRVRGNTTRTIPRARRYGKGRLYLSRPLVEKHFPNDCLRFRVYYSATDRCLAIEQDPNGERSVNIATGGIGRISVGYWLQRHFPGAQEYTGDIEFDEALPVVEGAPPVLLLYPEKPVENYWDVRRRERGEG